MKIIETIKNEKTDIIKYLARGEELIANLNMSGEIRKVIERKPHATFIAVYNNRTERIANVSCTWEQVKAHRVKVFSPTFAIYEGDDGYRYGISIHTFDGPTTWGSIRSHYIKHSFNDNEIIIIGDYEETPKGRNAIWWTLPTEKCNKLLEQNRQGQMANF